MDKYTIPPNETFPFRWVSYKNVPANTGTFGIMEITEKKSLRALPHIRRYLVHDRGINPDELGRAFRVKKSLDKNKKERESEFYNVLLSAFGPSQHRYECRGYESTGRCCHIDGLAVLLRAGELPEANGERTNG